MSSHAGPETSLPAHPDVTRRTQPVRPKLRGLDLSGYVWVHGWDGRVPEISVGLVAPEGGREQHEQRKDLQTTEQHREGK